MTNDTIERILDDAIMSPKAYCHMYGCGQGIYDELADYVPYICIHLVGRTEAVMRHAGKDEGYRLGFDDGFASADDWLAQHESDMRRHGWMRLPLDSEGLPIHVGDRLMFADIPIVAAAVTPERVYYWDDESDMLWTRSANCRHYVPLTVEDILREFGGKYHSLLIESMSDVSHDLPAPAEIIAEYAKRLRLAGDEE